MVHSGAEDHINQCPSLRARVLEVGARWSSAQIELIGLVVALDESCEWVTEGAPTCAHWLADHLAVEVSTAREWLRIGRALAALPAIRAAFEQENLSYSKARALTRVATADNEHALLEIALRVPANRLAHALAAYLNRTETPEQTERRHHAARGLRWRLDPDGMISFFLRLPPATAGRLQTAVDTTLLKRHAAHAADAERTGRWPSVAQQRADALIAVLTGGGARVSTEVVLHVRGDGCTMHDGTPIADHAVASLLDQSFIRALIHDAHRRPINASGRQRHPTTRQQRVVHERDGGACVDCGSTDLIQFDHDPDYAVTHRTVVDELVCRCAICHHRRHGPPGRS